ncbi:MAG: methyltransferase domain-containing protein [Candidatus Hydrogenedentes bacterium]|nr:methyltransferase domain-containing protein [Candidatus Hydrogenedentota bacterium]
MRRPAQEEMDREDIDRGALEGALRSLIRINAVGNGAGIFWPALREMILHRDPGCGPMRVLDVACGGGDLAWRLELRARKEGLELQVDGCDRSPIAVEMAQTLNATAGTSGTFFVLDAVKDDMPGDYDVIFSSLFLHHLDNAESEHVLKKMVDKTRSLVLLSDLIRSRFGLALVHLATRTLSRSPVVHSDGVTSLLAAYSMLEVQELIHHVGLFGATLERRWPERFLLTWHKS